MWKTPSVRRWMCLLTLAVAIIFITSEASPFIRLPCCTGGHGRNFIPTEVTQCFQQKIRTDCKIHAYLIKTSTGLLCVRATNKWLNEKIAKGELKCPPVISKCKRF
ncbi:hypothetical protein Q5P01_004458 [Channa striata]|uniref:Chemokine interleukin-8-like domain-containing protein n=1 Tax=Channa striata TaxID=64152 RepID=A0AA88NMP2_CHASR|nr:hypothetical protein Q5P01_004458 [Channa striata]